jgi:hypothetical protein
MLIGEPSTPDPFGHSCPVQLSPASKRMVSPGWNVVEFTLLSERQGALVLVPELLSLPVSLT